MPKVAILIDGAFFLKRLKKVRNDIDCTNPEEVAKTIEKLVNTHLRQLSHNYSTKMVRPNSGREKEQKFHAASIRFTQQNGDDCFLIPNPYSLLHKCFYYDARPFLGKMHKPISGKAIDYAKTEVARFQLDLFKKLRAKRNFIVRLGEVASNKRWILNQQIQKKLLRKEITIDDLHDDDFVPSLRQKGVDMRIGIDIVWLTLSEQVQTIILVTGDADFVPAAKLARRHGVEVILDPLWQNVREDLREHIDNLYSGFSLSRKENE